MPRSSIKIELYSADWCAYCRQLKKWLDDHRLAYVEKNVEDPGMRRLMNKLTHGNQTIPVLCVGENCWVNPSVVELQEIFKAQLKQKKEV